nr:MarR family transcriptional regulator [Millisia brevis]
MRTERVDHMLTPSQLQALGHLRREGAMTAARLAHFEQVTPQSIARTLAMLEEQGMIRRGSDPTDARATRVEITDTGLATLALDAEMRTLWLCELLDERCTAHEREMLFVAAAILRDLSR